MSYMKSSLDISATGYSHFFILLLTTFTLIHINVVKESFSRHLRAGGWRGAVRRNHVRVCKQAVALSTNRSVTLYLHYEIKYLVPLFK